MKNIRVFLTENFQFLEVKFSIYLNRRVFVMLYIMYCDYLICAFICICQSVNRYSRLVILL